MSTLYAIVELLNRVLDFLKSRKIQKENEEYEDDVEKSQQDPFGFFDDHFSDGVSDDDSYDDEDASEASDRDGNQ